MASTSPSSSSSGGRPQGSNPSSGFKSAPFGPGQPSVKPAPKAPDKPQPKPSPNSDPFQRRQWIPTKPLLKGVEKDYPGAIPGSDRRFSTKDQRVNALKGIIGNREYITKNDLYDIEKKYRESQYRLDPNAKRAAEDAIKYFREKLKG